ncbi:MAG: hypothetical protein ABR548_00265 [Actinomycetota bacterium]|nr:hypothetical protein [Actinomycetota bacterium]
MLKLAGFDDTQFSGGTTLGPHVDRADEMLDDLGRGCRLQLGGLGTWVSTIVTAYKPPSQKQRLPAGSVARLRRVSARRISTSRG